MEWAEVYRRVVGPEPEPVARERKIQKFPSRERNHAVRRRRNNNNNNVWSHANCPSCAKIAQQESNG